MDTSRLIINTIDKSSYSEQEETRLTGFTVVKAPKGPLTPVRIPAGGASKLQDIFGVSSKDYPELFEVEVFNKEYDVWVSAPYIEGSEDGSGTFINTALVTTDGIFASNSSIPYTSKIEDEIFKGEEPLDIGDLIKTVGPSSDKVEVLKDYRFSGTYNFKGGEDLGYNEYPEWYDSSSGISYLKIKTGISSDISMLGASFKIKGFNKSLRDVFSISDKSNKKVIDCNNTVVGEAVVENSLWVLKINGTSGISETDIISQDYIKNILDEDSERRKLSVYWIDSIDIDNVKGVIFPKYPSSRDLHISFTAFDDKINYSNKNAAGRNLLKMTVYEDGAFHNSAHKLSINGSLNPADVDSNGAPIGFTESNSSYSNQDLIYVYSIGSGFVDSDDFNLKIKKHPDIIISGGYREFESFVETKDESPNPNKKYYIKNKNNYIPTSVNTFETGTVYYEFTYDSLSLHNYGWEKALDPDFSDVNIFFSSQDTSNKSLNTLKSDDRFFSLVTNNSDGHNLGGYIFNYSATPGEVDAFTKSINYLSFGRNYWNVCNMAIIQLRDGSKIFSPMTGAKALMQCRIIERRYGGIAPMWENEGNPGIGGQLDMINPVRLRYKYNKEQLDTLNSYNYNPVINDRQYGIMVVGQKTCKSGEITDWSYIGHACAFFEFIREVRANVMIPQIGKANNPYYRDLRAKQVLQYLRQRTEGDNRIWAAASVDTSTADGVNDIYARKALKFVINVSVTVDIFSEKVELNFTNEDQTSIVSYSDSTEE